jgi:murein DD-endopeptidase MepM/ murein hydrolase activator NlpD
MFIAAVILLSCEQASRPSEILARDVGALTESDVFDWPMGANQGGDWVPGHDVLVIQNYGNINPEKQNRRHAAVDLAHRSTLNAGAPVYAAANGTIRCVALAPNPSDPESGFRPGAVIVVEHALSDGTARYSMYGHLNNTTLTEGTRVTRGQQIGTLWTGDSPSDSHLHYEIRTQPYVQGSCTGEGYATGSGDPDLQGWRDPIVWHYTHRPAFPGTTVSDLDTNVRSAPMLSAQPIAVVTAGTRVTASSVMVAQDGRDEWWYRVRYDGVNWGYTAGYHDQGWGGDLLMVELRRTCPYDTLQVQVQSNASTPWSDTLTITEGASFNVGSMYNGTGWLTGCCTTITVTGPNGYQVTVPNLGMVTPPTAGTYWVRGTCFGVMDTAVVTVNPACPYNTIQSRVQPNSQTDWSATLTIAAGASFNVGSMYNGGGHPTPCCTTIQITGPGGFAATPPNLSSVTAPYSGTYSVVATCGPLSDTATVTATSVVAPSALDNSGMETQSSAQFGSISGWGPNGAWAYHSQFPRNGNASLGTRFGYYSAGATETVGQLLSARFQANRQYTFRGYAQGGGDNTGVVPFQLGYAATDGVLSSFVLLKTAGYAVGADWQLKDGAAYRTPLSGGPLGKQIIVRLGDGASGGQGDVWFDGLELLSERLPFEDELP